MTSLQTKFENISSLILLDPFLEPINSPDLIEFIENNIITKPLMIICSEFADKWMPRLNM